MGAGVSRAPDGKVSGADPDGKVSGAGVPLTVVGRGQPTVVYNSFNTTECTLVHGSFVLYYLFGLHKIKILPLPWHVDYHKWI
jgi:hypothetical protein